MHSSIIVGELVVAVLKPVSPYLLLRKSHGQGGLKDQSEFVWMMLEIHAKFSWDQHSIIIKIHAK